MTSTLDVTPPQYVTIATAASALAVDTQTIRRMIAANVLPAVKVGVKRTGECRDGRLIRIPVSALATILEPIGSGS